MSKQKYYVVWKGHKPGIYTSWAECEKQVKGFGAAQYKAFDSVREAEAAYRSNYETFKGKPASHGKWREASTRALLPSICVDAACSGSPGKVEYRGVFTESGEEIFRVGPFPDGTNNVVEFLAIVHALTWLAKHEKDMPIYSDSENGILRFLEVFVRNRGNVKEMERETGESYWAIGRRLDEVITEMGMEAPAPVDDLPARRQEILGRLSRGEINVQEATQLLSQLKGDHP